MEDAHINVVDIGPNKNVDVFGVFDGHGGKEVAGVDPNIMGIGPVPATQKVLEKAGLSLADMDVIEINEAFASQVLACDKELNMDAQKVNVNGGAVALGHPIGASGARIILTLAYELKRRGGGLGIAAICSGGGQGDAVLIEVSN